LFHLLLKWFAVRGKAVSARARRSVRPGLEALDERVLPSVTSLGDATGFTYGDQYASSDRTVARSSITGNYAVTFQGTGYAGSGIYARLFNAAGTPLTGTIHVGSTTAADFSPTIAMNARGDFAVAYTHRYSSSDLDLYAQRFHANGTPAGGDFAVAITTHNEYEPSAALDNFGNLMIAYTYDYSSTDKDIRVWTQQPTGAVNTFGLAVTGNNEHAPSLALNANGYGVVAYEYDYSATDHDIYAQRVFSGGTGTSGGSSYGGRLYIDTSTLDQYDPSVAVNSTTAFVVSYSVLQSSGASQVMARQFDASNTYQGQVTVGDGDTRSQFGSSVVLDNAGRFLIAYSLAYGPGDYDVRAELFNSDNTVRDASFAVAATTFYEYTPTVALGVTDLTANYSGGNFSDGQAVFAFQTYGIKSNGHGSGGYGVSAARAYNL
jgi:hypothetical protein